MKSITLTTFIFLQINVLLCKKYTNYTVFRAIPVSEDHVEYYKSLNQFYKVDYWKPPGLVNKTVDFMLGPDDKSRFLQEARERDLYVTTIIDDVQREFDKQTVKTYIRRKMDSFDWNNYYRYKDIYNWLVDLKRLHPEVIKLITIGRTEEYREIVAARVVLHNATLSILKDQSDLYGEVKPVPRPPNSKAIATANEPYQYDTYALVISVAPTSKLYKSTVIVEGGIHAREWIATAFVTYMLHQIVYASKSGNKELYKIAREYEWYFVPMINPDGYEFSHDQDRMWRKNRRGGYGVDVNRNFDAGYGSVGVSFKKTEDIYCGPAPFSEKETMAMAELVESKSKSLEYYLAFHSYGQYIIIPYAHSKKHLDNFDEMQQMCLEATRQISRRYGTKYTSGTAYDTVGYMTSGVSGCWAKRAYKIPYVATFELRDAGVHGFALPTREILPTCRETMDGIVSLLTPRTTHYVPLKENMNTGGQEKTFFSNVIIVFNAFLFIIIGFD